VLHYIDYTHRFTEACHPVATSTAKMSFKFHVFLTSLITPFIFKDVETSSCTFECPGEAKPVAIPDHVPSHNGCGSYGFRLEEFVKIPGFTECCNIHDICYEKCNKVKDDCDEALKTCLHGVCEAKDLPRDTSIACAIHIWDWMWEVVHELGCSAYEKAQKKACSCQ